jgi:hypothetical protein
MRFVTDEVQLGTSFSLNFSDFPLIIIIIIIIIIRSLPNTRVPPLTHAIISNY